MSTLKVDTLQTTGGAGLYPAKAWVNFNAVGTASIGGSANVSSLSDLGTAYFSVTFSNSFSDTSYVFAGSSNTATDGTVGTVCSDMGYNSAVANKGTSSMRHRLGRTGPPNYVDFNDNNITYTD